MTKEGNFVIQSNMLFSEEQLKDKIFLEEIIKKSRDFIDYDEFKEAYDLAKDLDQAIDKAKGFKDRNYDLYRQYRKIIKKLKWVGLPIMTEDMAADMFKYHFTVIFSIPDYSLGELWRKLKSILLSIMVFEDRDKFKKELRDALLNNEEKITAKELTINNQKKNPTVGNWIKDYNSELGTGIADNLKRVQYFTSNKNLKNLDEKDREKVKTLLDLYEKLKLSSLTLEGLEEDIPVDYENMKGIIKGGVFEPFKEEEISPLSASDKDKQPDISQLKNMAARFPAGSLERKAIEEEIEKMNTE